jgi:hypothetical protein
MGRIQGSEISSERASGQVFPCGHAGCDCPVASHQGLAQNKSGILARAVGPCATEAVRQPTEVVDEVWRVVDLKVDPDQGQMHGECDKRVGSCTEHSCASVDRLKQSGRG